MPTRLVSVVIDAVDPAALSRFWSDLLGWRVTHSDGDEVDLGPPPGESCPVELVFVPVPEAGSTKNRLHLDLASTSSRHQAELVERALALGARHADVGQGEVPWVVLADPEGNEFCVLEPRPEYQDTGAIAAVVMDTPDLVASATFWTTAAGWPIARRDDRFASLRSPDGRGPWLELLPTGDPKPVKNRIHLDVAPFADDDQAAEVDRLRALGAHPADVGQGEVPWVVLTDPAGNEFCVLSSR